MSFDLLIVAVLAVLAVLAYRLGLHDGMQAKQGEPPTMPEIRTKAKAARTDNDKYFDTLLSNIDKYDGTHRGQEEVKRG